MGTRVVGAGLLVLALLMFIRSGQAFNERWMSGPE